MPSVAGSQRAKTIMLAVRPNQETQAAKNLSLEVLAGWDVKMPPEVVRYLLSFNLEKQKHKLTRLLGRQAWSGGDVAYDCLNEGYFEALFRTVALSLGFKLTMYDLFHGHIMKSSENELCILFHANENPKDTINQNVRKAFGTGDFDTSSDSYKKRNVLYVASTGRFYAIITAAEANQVLLFDSDQLWFEQTKVNNVVDPDNFGENFCDINWFPVSTNGMPWVSKLKNKKGQTTEPFPGRRNPPRVRFDAPRLFLAAD